MLCLNTSPRRICQIWGLPPPSLPAEEVCHAYFGNAPEEPETVRGRPMDWVGVGACRRQRVGDGVIPTLGCMHCSASRTRNRDCTWHLRLSYCGLHEVCVLGHSLRVLRIPIKSLQKLQADTSRQ